MFYLRSLKIVMANPNPEDPNVPNKDVPEEDPYHLLDYDEEEDPKMDIEEEEPEEDPEEDENEDVDIEEDDDAEIIFPYEEAGVEPEVKEAGVEPEVEEAGDEPKAEGADVELEAEELDGGLAPWALRHDLETLRRQERIREAESETSRTEESLGKVVERLKVLKSEENTTLKKKLAEKEVLLDLTRAVLKPPSNDEGSERPRKMPKKSNEHEGPSDPRRPLMIMPPKPMSEARMREIIRDQFATSINEFMANMNNGAGGSGGASGSGGAGGSGGTGGNADGTGVRGAGPTVSELTRCTYATFIKCDPLPFNGTEGAVGLCQWFEKLESMFQISECKEKDRVKFAMATLRRRALTWWNGRTKTMGIKAANNTPWSEVRKWMTEEFCPRSVIQRM
nr:putative zinc finger, CCHC-type, retrotransposon Gag domain protein [Tanacetum cinerariifolium]